MGRALRGDRHLARHLVRWLADHAHPRPKIIDLDPARGFAAETVAASVLYTTAYVFQAPISTTHTITSAVMGVGATKRLSAVRWGVARSIVIAWVLTFPAACAAALAFTWSRLSSCGLTRVLVGISRSGRRCRPRWTPRPGW